jgi:hypothetical protein
MEPLRTSGATPPQPRFDAGARYHARAQRFRAAEARENSLSARMSWLRLAAFLALVAALLIAERGTGSTARGALLAAAGMGATFLVLLLLHRRVRIREGHAAALASVNEEGALRLARRWNDLPAEPWGEVPPDRPEAEDLNLVGRASLVRLLGPPPTVPGRETLVSWLLDGADPDEIAERQEAVRSLAPMVDFRDEWAARGRTLPPGTSAEVTRFLEWAEGDRWLPARSGLKRAAWIFPVLTGVLGWLHLAGVAPSLWLLPLGVTVFLASRSTSAIHARYDAAMAGEAGVRRYDTVLELLATLPPAAPRLNRLRQRVEEPDGVPAHEAVARLRRILDMAEARRSMLGPGLQLVMLWDVHVLVALERWQERHGGNVRRWLGAIGEVEALAALARLADDHPDWAFPVVSGTRGRDGGPVVQGESLGHPLLPPDRCVRNDVKVGPPGTLLLVTGSNMSGKSTLLRALGANAALAGAGAPVCAASLSLPPLRIATCMRVQDALDEGVSLFMAELRRLRAVVDLARQTPGTGRTLLYLLDEMLQGTNTAERQVAARQILSHLVASGAIGAVTTHDLALADTGLAGEAVHVHFRETVEAGPEGTVLHFDYRLRPGPATSRNALRLLEAVGLGGPATDVTADAPSTPG